MLRGYVRDKNILDLTDYLKDYNEDDFYDYQRKYTSGSIAINNSQDTQDHNDAADPLFSNQTADLEKSLPESSQT